MPEAQSTVDGSVTIAGTADELSGGASGYMGAANEAPVYSPKASVTSQDGAASNAADGLDAPVYNSQGATRAAKYGGNWSSGSLNETVESIAGSNPAITYTVSGKTIYTNSTTGASVVYDNAGNYYRVRNAAGQYLDQSGNAIPNNVPLVGPNKTTQTGVPRDVRNALTHFNNTDPVK